MPNGLDDLRRAQAAAADQMQAAATALAALEDADAPDDAAITQAQATFDAAQAAFDRVRQQVIRAEAVEAARAAAARNVGGDLSPPSPGVTGSSAVPATPAEPGLRFGAMVRTVAVCGGDMIRAQALADAQGNSGLFANLNPNTAGAGGVFIPEEVSGNVIEFLRPASVVARMGARTLPMENGNLTHNRIAQGSTFDYQAEGTDAPVTTPSFGQMRLTAKTMRGLVPIQNSLLRQAGTAVDRLVADDMRAGAGQAMDRYFLRGPGGDGAPLGLRFQAVGTAAEATQILAANGTVNLVNVTNDLGRAELALANAEIDPMSATWIMAPRTAMFLMNLRDGNGNLAFPSMEQGRLRMKPVLTTTQIPVNLGGSNSEIMLAAPDQIVIGDTLNMQVAVSSEATYRDAQGNLQSAFSLDQTVIRLIVQNDIGLRHLTAVSVLTGVTWQP